MKENEIEIAESSKNELEAIEEIIEVVELPVDANPKEIRESLGISNEEEKILIAELSLENLKKSANFLKKSAVRGKNSNGERKFSLIVNEMEKK